MHYSCTHMATVGFKGLMLLLLQNFNIYRRIFMDVLQLPNTNKPEAYKLWSDLRDMLCDLVSSICYIFAFSALCVFSYLQLF